MQAYRVELDNPGCATCGAGKTFSVAGPGQVVEAISYASEEDAKDWADALNAAYDQGRTAVLNIHSKLTENITGCQN